MDKVIVGGNVNGDITSCKIENQLVSVDRAHAWSIQETSNYVSYDVCSKQVLNTYSVPEFTAFSVIAVLVGALLFFAAVSIIAEIVSEKGLNRYN